LFDTLAIRGHHFTNDVVFKFSAVGWHFCFTPTAPLGLKKKLNERTTSVTEGARCLRLFAME
jgi:hypothetical protein